MLKPILLLAILASLVSGMHKYVQDKDGQDGHDDAFPPRYEVRSKIYAQLSTNQDLLTSLLGEGITSNYK